MTEKGIERTNSVLVKWVWNAMYVLYTMYIYTYIHMYNYRYKSKNVARRNWQKNFEFFG